MEQDRDIERAVHGRLAGATLANVRPMLDEMEASVDRRVHIALKNARGLTEQQALQAWYEKAAIWQLREKLSQQVAAGKSASQRVAPLMELPNAA